MRTVSFFRFLAPLLLVAGLAWPAGPAAAMCGGNIFATCAPVQGRAHKLARGRRTKTPPTRNAGRKRPG